MAYTLQQLSDLEDIKILKHRYFRAIDTNDVTLLASVLAEDVVVDYRGGTYRVELRGRDDMVTFVSSAINSGMLAMHHGHMPEITLTGDDNASGIWYLQDIVISVERQDHTEGSAIYRDEYRRIDGRWQIVRTEYDRVIEFIRPLAADIRVTAHLLAEVGRKPHERSDISRMISDWTNVG